MNRGWIEMRNTARLIVIAAVAILAVLIAWKILTFVTWVVAGIIDLALFVVAVYVIFLIARSVVRRGRTA